MFGWAQLLEDEDLSGPTSTTAKQFGTDFVYPTFFSVLQQAVVKLQLHSLASSVSWSPEKTQKLYIRSDGR